MNFLITITSCLLSLNSFVILALYQVCTDKSFRRDIGLVFAYGETTRISYRTFVT